MKIAILHDYFQKSGGGERLVINTARSLKADIFTGFVDQEIPSDINVTSLNVKPTTQPFTGKNIAKKFSTLHLPEYDFFIFSGVWCISAAFHLHPNLLYLHTPPRFMYDLNDYFMKNSNPLKKILLKKFIREWKPKDQEYMKNFDIICPNSKNTERRFRKYYPGNNTKTQVVYTGIDTIKFRTGKDEDFFLSASRLDPLKRIDIIIEAFKKNQKRLIITGSGPDEKRLKKLAKGFSNIEFTGKVSEKKLIDLYATCSATITAAIDEDLGLTPIESNAAAKPCIAVNEGGYIETVIPEKTGLFFSPSSDSLNKAIDKFSKSKFSKTVMKKNAEKYDIDVFAKNIQKIIRQTMK